MNKLDFTISVPKDLNLNLGTTSQSLATTSPTLSTSIAPQNLPTPSLLRHNYHSTLRLNCQSGEKNCTGYIVEKVINAWKWVLSWFFSTNQINSNNLPHVQSKIDFGNNFITNMLQEGRLREIATPSCKMAIVAKSNGRVIYQHLTAATLETLPELRQLATQKLTHHLTQHEQNHRFQSSDELKMEIYLLRSNQSGLCSFEYEFHCEHSGFGHDKNPELPRDQSIQYFASKIGGNGTFTDDFFRFMMFD